MIIRKHLCWLLGHKKDLREWPYSGKYVKIMVPYCKHCDVILTPLPLEMLVQKAFYEHYSKLPAEYKELF